MPLDASFTEILGHAAGLLTTLCFVPQVVRTYRTREVDGLSLPTFALLMLGNLSWLTYGVLLESAPVIAANAATFCLALSMVVMKLLFGKRPERRR